MEILFGGLIGIIVGLFIALFCVIGKDDIVCHCEIKENAELIAKILDFDVNGEIYQPVCSNADTGGYYEEWNNEIF